MKSLIFGTAILAVGLATTVHAATITPSLGPVGNTLVFDDNVASNSLTPASFGTSHGYSWSTTNGGVFDMSVGGVAAAPDPSHYLVAEGNANVSFSARNSIDILWGSLDTYNTLTLSNSASITGTMVASDLGILDNGSTGYWITISSDTPFTSFSATSSQAAFEFDLSAVPEPSTWAMMGIGFAAVGYLGFRRANKAPRVLA